jgi:hypothetical protein
LSTEDSANKPTPHELQIEDVPRRKYKKRKFSEINNDERKEIIRKAKIDKLNYDEIAREY